MTTYFFLQNTRLTGYYGVRYSIKTAAKPVLHFHVVSFKVPVMNKIKRVSKIFKSHKRFFRWVCSTSGCCLN